MRELADGADAVARGSLDATVPVRTRDEVGELAATFNAMTRDLSIARDELVLAERVAAWREIARRIAHEIKNPLTPIQMAIETLQRAHKKRPRSSTRSSTSRRDHPRGGRRASSTSSHEFSALRAHAGADAGAGRVSRSGRGARSRSTPAARPRSSVTLPSDLPPRARRSRAAQQVLHQPRRERARRGRRRPAGTSASPRARVDGRVELEVADNGPGLSDEARAKLFTPYFTTKPRGTGLGLAIVHRIVSDHGGEIRVGARPAQGAIFTVSLPRAEDAEGAYVVTGVALSAALPSFT